MFYHNIAGRNGTTARAAAAAAAMMMMMMSSAVTGRQNGYDRRRTGRARDITLEIIAGILQSATTRLYTGATGVHCTMRLVRRARNGVFGVGHGFILYCVSLGRPPATRVPPAITPRSTRLRGGEIIIIIIL